MKFSARTIQILRNFATVHQALLFKSGSTLKVMSESKSILAKATLEDNIEDGDMYSTLILYNGPSPLRLATKLERFIKEFIPAMLIGI